ncbi:MAG: transposase [Actinobacteria bacterium]|nr:MAG: transposase [Actinomycetota bacterium]
MTRYRWVAARKAEGFPITMSCAVAEVSRQAFHDWRARSSAGPTRRELAEAELVALMREIHAESDATYGEPRMTEELAHRGRVVNHKRVRRLMRNHGIVGVHKPAKVRTTLPAEECPPLPDLVGRRFAPGRRMSCGVVTSPTSRPVKGGCTSRRYSILVRVACSATPWPSTCAPASSPTRSRWPPRPVAVRPPGSSSMVTAAASTCRATTAS